jgi:hypothetical protein
MCGSSKSQRSRTVLSTWSLARACRGSQIVVAEAERKELLPLAAPHSPLYPEPLPLCGRHVGVGRRLGRRDRRARAPRRLGRRLRRRLLAEQAQAVQAGADLVKTGLGDLGGGGPRLHQQALAASKPVAERAFGLAPLDRAELCACLRQARRTDRGVGGGPGGEHAGALA